MNYEHHEKVIIPRENQETIENHRIQLDKHDNHENLGIPYANHENHENLNFQMRIAKIMKI